MPRCGPANSAGRRGKGEDTATERRAARSTKARPLETTIRGFVTPPSRSIWKWTTGLKLDAVDHLGRVIGPVVPACVERERRVRSEEVCVGDGSRNRCSLRTAKTAGESRDTGRRRDEAWPDRTARHDQTDDDFHKPNDARSAQDSHSGVPAPPVNNNKVDPSDMMSVSQAMSRCTRINPLRIQPSPKREPPGRSRRVIDLIAGGAFEPPTFGL